MKVEWRRGEKSTELAYACITFSCHLQHASKSLEVSIISNHWIQCCQKLHGHSWVTEVQASSPQCKSYTATHTPSSWWYLLAKASIPDAWWTPWFGSDWHIKHSSSGLNKKKPEKFLLVLLNMFFYTLWLLGVNSQKRCQLHYKWFGLFWPRQAVKMLLSGCTTCSVPCRWTLSDSLLDTFQFSAQAMISEASLLCQSLAIEVIGVKLKSSLVSSLCTVLLWHSKTHSGQGG